MLRLSPNPTYLLRLDMCRSFIGGNLEGNPKQENEDFSEDLSFLYSSVPNIRKDGYLSSNEDLKYALCGLSTETSVIAYVESSDQFS